MHIGLGINSIGRLSWSPLMLGAGVIDLSQIDTRSFSDTDGLTPAAVGGPVGALRDLTGAIVATGAGMDATRPFYARRPVGGLRNVANGADDMSNATAWPTIISANGVTVTKIASGVGDDGLPFVDYTAVGTASATASSGIQLYLSGMSRAPAAPGQTWTVSILAQIITGTVPTAAGTGVRLEVNGETAAGVFLENTSLTPPQRPTTETTVFLTSTLANAGTQQTRCGVVLRTDAGVTVNYTIRIKALQFERGSARTAWQANSNEFDTTEAGKGSVFALRDDLLGDDVFNVAIPAQITGATIAWANENGVTISTGQTIAAGNFNVLSLAGREKYGVIIAPRALTAGETANLAVYLQAKRGF